MDFKDSETKVNVARAFVSECVDGARYQFMAKDAKAKGYGFLSNQFKMLAKNEMAHATVFYNFILSEGKSGGELGEGAENIDICVSFPFMNYTLPNSLELVSNMEKHESTVLYKEFEETALREGFKDIAKAFHHVVQVENCHHLMLDEYFQKINSKKLYKMTEINKWKCSNCGTEIEQKEAPDPCPLCGYDQGYYMIPTSDQQ